MQELIKTSAAVIGGEEVNAVNARELWKALGSKRRYSDWIKDRLEGFVEGKDFAVHKKMNGKNISLNSGLFSDAVFYRVFREPKIRLSEIIRDLQLFNMDQESACGLHEWPGLCFP